MSSRAAEAARDLGGGAMNAHRAARPRRSLPLAALGVGMTCLLLLLISCKSRHEQSQAQAATGGGSSTLGRKLITQYGCPSCHSIPGIQGPKGVVGPPLDHIAQRTFIAGKVKNTPQNVIQWLQNPQSFDPANAMPNLGIPEKDARDIAAYLYTLK